MMAKQRRHLLKGEGVGRVRGERRGGKRSRGGLEGMGKGVEERGGGGEGVRSGGEEGEEGEGAGC